MNVQTTRRLAAGAMATAAVLAVAGFTALGSIFEYPQILKEPITRSPFFAAVLTAQILKLSIRSPFVWRLWMICGCFIGGSSMKVCGSTQS